ncbi:hypothetical protein K9M42_03170 [Patescibacteria group bacterium]|nr:hypothetical protein [Patescibacteria group bacterium]
MKNKFDIKKLKYLKGAIENGGMTDDEIKKWMDNNKYTKDDLYEIIKILVISKTK